MPCTKTTTPVPSLRAPPQRRGRRFLFVSCRAVWHSHGLWHLVTGCIDMQILTPRPREHKKCGRLNARFVLPLLRSAPFLVPRESSNLFPGARGARVGAWPLLYKHHVRRGRMVRSRRAVAPVRRGAAVGHVLRGGLRPPAVGVAVHVLGVVGHTKAPPSRDALFVCARYLRLACGVSSTEGGVGAARHRRRGRAVSVAATATPRPAAVAVGRDRDRPLGLGLGNDHVRRRRLLHGGGIVRSVVGLDGLRRAEAPQEGEAAVAGRLDLRRAAGLRRRAPRGPADVREVAAVRHAHPQVEVVPAGDAPARGVPVRQVPVLPVLHEGVVVGVPHHLEVEVAEQHGYGRHLPQHVAGLFVARGEHVRLQQHDVRRGDVRRVEHGPELELELAGLAVHARHDNARALIRRDLVAGGEELAE
mmetsp:Transcript_31459/g.99766  ORF Transcript_31459/g.99766 Transcript_31459/m.99766 type:complete len:417 (-) Transcript_31459:1484-2734(-)